MNFVCIFCINTFGDKSELFDHLFEHMCRPYYCIECDGGLPCNEEHKIDTNFDADEQDATQNWMEALIKLQTNRKDSKKRKWRVFDGCPMCDIDHVLQEAAEDESNLRDKFMTHVRDKYKKERKHVGDQERMSDTVLLRHVFNHLKYYPFACQECSQMKQLGLLCDSIEHMKTLHRAVQSDMDAFRRLKYNKISKLEQFISYHMKANVNIHFDSSLQSLKRPPGYVKSMPKSEKYKLFIKENDMPVKVNIKKLTQEEIDYHTEPKNLSQSLNSSSSSNVRIEPIVDEDAETPASKRKRLTVPTLDTTLCYDSGDDFLKNCVEKERYFCFSCWSEYDNITSVFECIQRRECLSYTAYKPYTCKLCDIKTASVKLLAEHCKDSHPDQRYFEYKVTRKLMHDWLRDFLNSQDFKVPDKPYFYCIVCQHYEKNYAAPPLNEPIDYAHIHTHMKYTPYECIVCKNEGKCHRISYPNSESLSHISQEHPDHKFAEIGECFTKSFHIKELDDCIDNYCKLLTECDETRPKKRGRKPGSTMGPKCKGKKVKVENSPECSNINRSRSESIRKRANGIISPKFKFLKNGLRSQDAFDEYFCDSKDESVLPSKCQSEGKRHIICIYCENISDGEIPAEHYYNHLNYCPVHCQLCRDKCFVNFEQLKKHGIEHTEIARIPYRLSTTDSIELWLKKFIRSQTDVSSTSLLHPPVRFACCPLCDKLSPDIEKVEATSKSELTEHIFDHISYTPYECNQCNEGDKFTVSSIINQTNQEAIDEATDHLKKIHKVTAFGTAVLRHFTKTMEITSLENFVSMYIDRGKCPVASTSEDTDTQNYCALLSSFPPPLLEKLQQVVFDDCTATEQSDVTVSFVQQKTYQTKNM